jgi:hypothetical protein
MLGFLWHLFSAHVAEKIEAAFIEFGLLALAIMFIAAAVAAAMYLPKIMPFRGKIIALLVILAAVSASVDYGYRWRGRLDASANYLREIEEKNAEIAERQRQAGLARAAAEAAGAREREAADQSQSLAQQVSAYEVELAKRPANNVCVLSDADLRFLRGIGTRPKPRGN